MSKQDQHSIIEPTADELVIYKQLTQDIPDYQMDELANEYFEEVSGNNLNISFPRFIINKMVRPIKEGDTISFKTAEGIDTFLFCLIRKEIEDRFYLLFAEADGETEDLKTEVTYLFYVDGVDEIGTEIIDIMPSGEETERILDIMEEDADVILAKGKDDGEEQSRQG